MPSPRGCAALIVLLALNACREGEPPLTVFAAASLTDVLTGIARSFEADTATTVRLNFAASSTLARQIEAGARADVFVSAHPEWIEHLERRGRLAAGTRAELARNELVLVLPRSRSTVIEITPGLDVDETLPGRIAIGDPAHVPAGRYAREALEALGWYEKLESRLVLVVDVRAALRLVELGEADGAFVYATDAAVSPRVTIAARIEPALHSPIVYTAALGDDARVNAADFLAYLRGPESRRALGQDGFMLPP